MELHLIVIQDNGESNVKLWNPRQHDFHWNSDFTAFYPVKLLWWDNASYIAYQCDCDDRG